MALSLLDIARLDYKTSRAADELNSRLQTLTALPHRYGPARLAIGRSLGVASMPALDLNHLGYGKAIKGEHLFGHGTELAAWISLIIEHSGADDVDRREFQALVAAHWQRGVNFLWEDWKMAGASFDSFVARLVRHSGRSREGRRAAVRA
jgi:DNA sulfur modification protein DndE